MLVKPYDKKQKTVLGSAGSINHSLPLNEVATATPVADILQGYIC